MICNPINTALVFALLCFSDIHAQVDNAVDEEFLQFKKELSTYRAIQRVKNGHIVNPYWGISSFSDRNFYGVTTNFSDAEYNLVWSVENDPFSPRVRKGDGSPFKRSDSRYKYEPGSISFELIGSKYVVVRKAKNEGKTAILTCTLHYYERRNTFIEEGESILSDTTLNVHSLVWYFIPALSHDLQKLKDSTKIIGDSSQHVKEMVAFAKKMSLETEVQDDTIDANHTYICKYRIQQFFDYDDVLHSGIYDNEKKLPYSKLRGYKIQKINLQLSSGQIEQGLTYLSDYRLNEHQTGFYPFGKYAIFYEYNLQYQQMGHWTLENVCLCEVQNDN